MVLPSVAGFWARAEKPAPASKPATTRDLKAGFMVSSFGHLPKAEIALRLEVSLLRLCIRRIAQRFGFVKLRENARSQEIR